jgi:hypothetical protein
VQAGVEECDLFVTTTCSALGFGPGTLACASDCRFDTSGCSGTRRSDAGRDRDARRRHADGERPDAHRRRPDRDARRRVRDAHAASDARRVALQRQRDDPVVIALDGDVTSARDRPRPIRRRRISPAPAPTRR